MYLQMQGWRELARSSHCWNVTDRQVCASSSLTEPLPLFLAQHNTFTVEIAFHMFSLPVMLAVCEYYVYYYSYVKVDFTCILIFQLS